MKDDTISRQAVIDTIKKSRFLYDAMRKVTKLPTAQPEIVRCRDCRWRKDQSGSTAWLPCRAIVTPSDFSCCHAERRADGSD